jgi:DNA/RNA endonuclease YhcR with UshA esterase domain
MGETVCVRGTVYSTNKSGSTFFIDFDNTRVSFYGVSFRYTWYDLDGQCVEITGPVSEYRGRPQMVIEKKEQLEVCSD